MHSNDIAMRIMDFEACEIGACKTWDNGELVTRVIYDGEKMVKQMALTDEISEAEAMAWVVHGVVEKYAGENSPIVMWQVNLNPDAH
jgi:hypothetical protein